MLFVLFFLFWGKFQRGTSPFSRNYVIDKVMYVIMEKVNYKIFGISLKEKSYPIYSIRLLEK